MTAFATLALDVDQGIAVATFNTPDALNSLTEARLLDLENLLDSAEQRSEMRALILTGSGRAFCVGLDLSLLQRAFAELDYFETVVRRLNRIISRLEALTIPTIAAVNGFARAGGFEILLGCDFILAANEAKLGDVHTDAGVLPACASMRLARRVGIANAKEIIWSAKWLTGADAVHYGLAQRSVPLAQLIDAAKIFARQFTGKPRATLAYSKQIFQTAQDLNVGAAAEQELQLFMRYLRTEPYGIEGYRAFVEKREPSWRS
jgi:enoyl-CoA hydratase/carnithine racemase